MKRCPRCQITKDRDQFYATRGKPSSYCKDCSRAAQHEWFLDNRVRKADINRGWRQRNPERRKVMNRASQTVFNAVKMGKLVRATCCSQCRAETKTEAAHTDYGQPLLVTWLCRPCHRRWDQAQPKTLVKSEP